jgi:hypothetical protein
MVYYKSVTIRDNHKKTVDNQKKIRREDEGIAPTLAPIRLPPCVA